MKVRYQMTEGRYEGKHVHYASFDSSSMVAAAIEDMTFAPALSALPSLGDEDEKTSAREGLIAFVNGPTGLSNPNRQGLSSTLLDNADPHNILHETPALPLHADVGSTAYGPMWDVRFAEWTKDAINFGDRTELRSFDEVMQRVDTMDPTMPNLVTGFQGAKFGPVGIIVNCPLISIDLP